jgi:amino acid permease
MALGEGTSNIVFALTLAASLGVCSTYIAFVGQTLASLSADSISNNIVNSMAPDVDERTWELITAATVYPLSLVRNYGVFAFTSALGCSISRHRTEDVARLNS